jgi:hypothetical protein
MHEPLRAIEAYHLTKTNPEAVPISLGQIVELVPGNVHTTGGHFVEKGLPQMRARPFNESYIRHAMPAQPVAAARNELDPASTATDDDDAMGFVARSGRRWHRVRCDAGHR